MTTSSEIEVALRSSRTRTTVPSRINRMIGSSASDRSARSARGLVGWVTLAAGSQKAGIAVITAMLMIGLALLKEMSSADVRLIHVRYMIATTFRRATSGCCLLAGGWASPTPRRAETRAEGDV